MSKQTEKPKGNPQPQPKREKLRENQPSPDIKKGNNSDNKPLPPKK